MADSAHHGRLSSWIAVTVIMAGFTVSGVGMVLGPAWWLVWTGAGIAVVGGLLALAVDILSDVVVDAPRVMPEEAHTTPFGHEPKQVRDESHGVLGERATSPDPQSQPQG